MITLKLPYICQEPSFQEYLLDLRRSQSIVIRSSYNRFSEGLKQKEVRHSMSNLKGIDVLDSWMVQSGVMEGQYLNTTNKGKKVIFGGKMSFFDRLKNKITKSDYNSKRLLPLTIQGESPKNGNRKFNINIIEDKSIIFKPMIGLKYKLELQSVKQNWMRLLLSLEERSKKCSCPYQVKLDDKYIYITFQPLMEVKPVLKENRFIGIDLNPNHIGISVCEWKDNKQVVLETLEFDVTNITEKINSLNVPSTDKKFKHLNNKLNHETIEIVKAISNISKKWNCKFIFVEDLDFKNADPKGRSFNRLTRNHWKRGKFTQALEKRCLLNGVKLFSVKPQYTSQIGNLIHEYSDPVNASLEIGRRGFEVIILKNKRFYPDFSLSLLKDQWKKHFNNGIETWKDLFKEIKNSKLKYRVSPNELKDSFKVFSMDSSKSLVKCYAFY